MATRTASSKSARSDANRSPDPAAFDEYGASRYTGIPVSSLRRGRSDGQVPGRMPTPPFVRLGRKVLYRRADLDAFLAGLVAHK